MTMLVSDARSWSMGALSEQLHDDAGVSAEAVDMAANAMERRERICGEAYPFQVSGVGIRYAGAVNAYTAMLLMSQPNGSYRHSYQDLATAAEVFEVLTAQALPGLLGAESKAVRFGWPSQDGRPRAFPDAIKWLSALTGVPPGSAYRHPRRQDGGVDVVAWRPFGDGQPGVPLLLVQCTLEQDFVHKSADIDLRLWAGWLSFDVDPMTALAIPYTVSKEEDWKEMASRTVVLDRLRLATLMRHAGANAAEPVLVWSNAELDAWREGEN